MLWLLAPAVFLPCLVSLEQGRNILVPKSPPYSPPLELLCILVYPYLRSIYLVSLGLIVEMAMAPHSSTLAWKIPWMEEPGRLQSMGSLGVGYN